MTHRLCAPLRRLGLLTALTSILVLGGAGTPAWAQGLPDLTGFGWGLGFGVGVDVLESGQRVTGVFLDTRDFVRAEGISTASPRFILESHFYVWNYKRLHVGPSMGIEPMAEDGALFRSGFLGVAFGLQEGENSWNLILGYLLDFEVEFLAEEFQLNRRAPRGPDRKPMEPRTVTQSAGSLIFGTTYSW